MKPDPAPPKELRQHRRFGFPGVVHLRDRPGDVLRACDLSVGGVGVISGRPLGIGRTVEVALLNSSVRVFGVVRFEVQATEREWRIGIQFLEPQPELISVALSFTDSP